MKEKHASKPRKRASAASKSACVEHTEPVFLVDVDPLYKGAQTHVWRVLDCGGKEVLRDLAISEQMARSLSDDWIARRVKHFSRESTGKS